MTSQPVTPQLYDRADHCTHPEHASCDCDWCRLCNAQRVAIRVAARADVPFWHPALPEVVVLCEITHRDIPVHTEIRLEEAVITESGAYRLSARDLGPHALPAGCHSAESVGYGRQIYNAQGDMGFLSSGGRDPLIHLYFRGVCHRLRPLMTLREITQKKLEAKQIHGGRTMIYGRPGLYDVAFFTGKDAEQAARREGGEVLETSPGIWRSARRAVTLLSISLTLLLPLAAHAEPSKAPCVVNVQTAIVAQVAFLPGIGPAKAGEIVKARPANEEELDQVKGIGPATLEAIRPHVVYGDAPTTCTSKQKAEDKDGAK